MGKGERETLLAELGDHLTSSSWVNEHLFKPGMRNLFLQEKCRGFTKFNDMVVFLGDQYYHFKFFFQNLMNSREQFPTVVGFLQQAINISRFRFRLQALDMLVELAGCEALPSLINLVNGFHAINSATRGILDRLEGCMDVLESCMEDTNGNGRKLFFMLRESMIALEGKQG